MGFLGGQCVDAFDRHEYSLGCGSGRKPNTDHHWHIYIYHSSADQYYRITLKKSSVYLLRNNS